jgi:hypothetical protein
VYYFDGYLGLSYVVLFNPFFDAASNLADIREYLGVKNGFTVLAVVFSGTNVLHKAAGLNKQNLNIVVLAPPLKIFESEPSSFVGSVNSRLASPSENVFKGPYNMLGLQKVSISQAKVPGYSRS